jgi:hypothetical protein
MNNVVRASPREDQATIIAKVNNGTKYCSVCLQTLPLNLFPKEKFAKTKVMLVVGNESRTTTDDLATQQQPKSNYTCRQCTKNLTALRCKQSTKVQLQIGRKSISGIHRRPNNFGYCSYIDKLFGLDCFTDIVHLKAFTSAKDVSESMAAIQAANNSNSNNQQHKRSADNWSMKTKNVLCLCIGDGSTPRTAVLACFLEKKWDCISIDPALHAEWHGVHPKGVQRLIGFGGTLEEFLSLPKIMTFENAVVDDVVDDDKEQQHQQQRQLHSYDQLLLLCVHSHARFTGNANVANIHSMYGPNIPMTIISLPCCPKFRSARDIGRLPDIQYDDDCVFSACRRVEIWNFDHYYLKCSVCE